MNTLLTKYAPLRETPDEGGGGGAGGWTPPQGLPAEFAGTSADETLGKMLAGYADLNTRFSGMRDKLSQMPKAPDNVDGYSWTPSDKLKPFFGEDANANPFLGYAKAAMLEAGVPADKFAGIIEGVYGPAVEAGLLPPPWNPQTEIKA